MDHDEKKDAASNTQSSGSGPSRTTRRVDLLFVGGRALNLSGGDDIPGSTLGFLLLGLGNRPFDEDKATNFL